MPIVKINGGLGNQMFQYAFGRSLALRRREELRLDLSVYQNEVFGDTPRHYKLDRFAIIALPVDASELKGIKKNIYLNLRQKIGLKLHKDFNVRYHAWLANSRGSYFEGFFQSYKYFSDQAGAIRNELVLREALTGNAFNLAEEIKTGQAVSIHVRRGDYVTNHKNLQGYGICSLEYYQQAIAKIMEQVNEPHFYFFSDDIQWVKNNLKINGPTTYVSEFDFDETVELDLMSKCQHNIIANSTFSWWGAWLNRNPEKIVVAPKRWVSVTPYSAEDLLPPEWLKI